MMAHNLKQSNILLCGSARVGKSTLINAICQQSLIKSNTSLNSLTKRIDRYSYESSDGHSTHETNIWDTPGIESWNENEVRTYMTSLIEETRPLCMIYCASPGSFAALNHVAWLVSECHRQNIFCALVCTNMWAGRNRQGIVDEFCRVLSTVHPNIQPNKVDDIIYYENVALVTMVNSQEYIDKDFGVTKPPSGVDELIFGIAQCLNRDYMFAWFRTVSHNASFWPKMSSKLSDLFKIPLESFNSLFKNAANTLDFLFDLSDFPEQRYMRMSLESASSPRKETDELPFHDAEFIDMPEQAHSSKLSFTFKSENVEMAAQIVRVLSRLGAQNSKTDVSKTEHEQRMTVTAEFENAEQVDAIFDLWQLAANPQVNCTIVNES